MRKFVCALALAAARGLPALRSRVEEKEASIESVAGRRAPLFGGFIDEDECPCKVKSKTVDVDEPYTCGKKQTTKTKLFYPIPYTTTGKKYPVVFFHRGSNGYSGTWEKGYDYWLSQVACQCLVVVAPFTGPAKDEGTYRSFCSNNPTQTCKQAKDCPEGDFCDGCFQDKDLDIAYNFVKAKHDAGGSTDIYPYMNMKRLAIMGHSGGAHHLPSLPKYYWSDTTLHPEGIIKNNYLKAIVFSHGNRDLDASDPRTDTPVWWPAEHNVPTMFMTAYADSLVLHGKVYESYIKNIEVGEDKGVFGYNTVFVSTKGGHMAPLDDAQAFDVWTGRFLHCHLTAGLSDAPGAEDTCGGFYGSNVGVCKDEDLRHLCTKSKNWKDKPTYRCKTEEGETPAVGPKCKHQGSVPP